MRADGRGKSGRRARSSGSNLEISLSELTSSRGRADARAELRNPSATGACLVIITVLHVAATEVTKRHLYLLQGSHRPPPR